MNQQHNKIFQVEKIFHALGQQYLLENTHLRTFLWSVAISHISDMGIRDISTAQTQQMLKLLCAPVFKKTGHHIIKLSLEVLENKLSEHYNGNILYMINDYVMKGFVPGESDVGFNHLLKESYCKSFFMCFTTPQLVDLFNNLVYDDSFTWF
jgi:hypothetical protein